MLEDVLELGVSGLSLRHPTLPPPGCVLSPQNTCDARGSDQWREYSMAPLALQACLLRNQGDSKIVGPVYGRAGRANEWPAPAGSGRAGRRPPLAPVPA